jgi:hypothetical protein
MYGFCGFNGFTNSHDSGLIRLTNYVRLIYPQIYEFNELYEFKQLY